ncbi:MAG: hypothetical protein K9N34_09285 [Candidatus Marinimicrobia bacterium]|nr:hypothetical protein [Candidatus Neomarinimicrobiota bacterium]MCF7839971.1 hypothetical protein [Candidatus Neomarinimicrobiota bacterium]
MVFHGDIAIALTLIALGVGYLVLVKARKQENNGSKTIGLIIGWIVIVIAAFTLLCASYYTLRYWDDGYYSEPRPMMMQGRGMMGGGMMTPGMMMGRPHMQKGMMGKHCQHAGGMQHQCQQMQEQCMQMMQGKTGMSNGKMNPGMHHRSGSGMMQGMQKPDTTNQ